MLAPKGEITPVTILSPMVLWLTSMNRPLDHSASAHTGTHTRTHTCSTCTTHNTSGYSPETHTADMHKGTQQAGTVMVTGRLTICLGAEACLEQQFYG